MPDGELSTDEAELFVASNASATSSPIVKIGEEDGPNVENKEKDPRKIARKYQLDLCKKAVEENIIVYLETGCGKTHIAVLLIYELGDLIRKPQGRICIFLAPTVALVQQQGRVIEDSLDFKVGTYCGTCGHLKNHHDWEQEIAKYEVLVMTPQILLRSLYHCFIRMNSIALLIFDECHHAQIKSNHPYAEIMKVFYDKATASMCPRIFGMTASPVVGKDASSRVNLPKSINSLEKLLDAKIYTVGDKEELESYIASPVVKVYDYGPVNFALSSSYVNYCSKLEEIKHQCISTLGSKNGGFQCIRNTKRLLNRMHENIIFCLENLGLWGALQACQLLLTANCERNELMEDEGILSDDSVCDRYLAQAADIFASDCRNDGATDDLSDVEILKEPFFSKKLLRLIGILSTFRLQTDMKCIIFVNRIVTARSLSYILQKLKFLISWKCHFLVGVHSGLKSMSRKTMKNILEKFRIGELNLLVATKVGEEGLDIQTCCLVIRFDLPETVASFIQSRGRARMPVSEYAFLVNSGNERELNLINSFKNDEHRMNMEIPFRTSPEIFVGVEEKMYKVDSSGASVSSGYSISLLHHYCSKLPHDEYFDPKPSFFYFDDTGGTICILILPSNAPISKISSSPQSSMDAAKKDACLKAIEELHKLGALSDHLLPLGNSVLDEETLLVSSDSGSSEDDDTRGELHEMLVPAVLKEPWSDLENYVLNSYYIKFIPDPEDRTYKDFGLFVKSPLPKEAERMDLDLHLARRRSVMTKLFPSGVAEFSKEEIMQAQHFQEMFFKVILDRSKLAPEYVALGNREFYQSSSSKFYLLLPVILNNCENKVIVDWRIVQRCLSSPLFKTPTEAVNHESSPSDVCLQLANGCWSITDVENSLVYAPHKKLFYFITNIVSEKNGYSLYKESGTLSHVEHLKMSDIHLKHPGQPLLHAKPLFKLRNLLHNRKPEDSESNELDEYFIDLPPELCQLKIIGFSKDIGSSLSLLPSIMHRLENLLVAIELKHVFSASFPEGAEITANRVLEALTTEKCQERFSLERLESLGDAFLKFAVGRHLFLLHDALDEGELTRRRSNAVTNSNLIKLSTRSNLQVYIRDQPFDPCQFFVLGHPCPIICNKESRGNIHSQYGKVDKGNSEVRCSRNHHWLHKKTIADVVEALVGAFLVDRGFKAATAFLRWIGIRLDFQGSQVNDICAASKRFMPLSSKVDIGALENLLGYQFLHKGLLIQAFVHPSHSIHGGGCYQRLEFLGDAVLDYLITSYLFSVYPKLKPGQLTDLRSVSVNNQSFANFAVERSLHNFLIHDSCPLNEAIQKYVDFKTSSPEKGLFEGPKCPKVLGDLVESSFGAIFLDTGFDLNRVWKIMLSLLDPTKSLSSVQLNPIRELQELCQSCNWDLKFLKSKSGRNYSVDAKLSVADIPLAVSAINKNKKIATRVAAHNMFVKLKALGHAPKSKSLEEVLKGSRKMEAKLIGFDETPIDVVDPDTIELENLKLQQSLVVNDNRKTHIIKTETTTHTPCISALRKSLPSFEVKAGCSPSPIEVEGDLSNRSIIDPKCGTNLLSGGDSLKGTARSQLHEICAGNCWKPPLFECCKEEGPSHLRSFTYRVILEIEEASNMILECFSDSRTSKKAAAEHAAEGALWYLKHEGYLD